ncbi:MAG: hypothetical protein HND48_05220 [Chloroflexi bacterium]|nr:hypothetical protein [Chloroflexota bacterium]
MEIGVRQPLASAAFVIAQRARTQQVTRLTALIESELNVKRVETLDGADDVVEYKLNPAAAGARQVWQGLPARAEGTPRGDAGAGTPLGADAESRRVYHGRTERAELRGHTG